MAANVILIEASPRRAADGVNETVRLAGGGGQFPYFYGGQHYRAGVVQLPTIVTAITFDGGDFGAGGVPQAAELQWAASRKADLAAIANYFWIDAPITVRIGDENSAGTLPAVTITGKVLSATVDGGVVKLQLSDPAADLKKPLLTARFGGTGGVDGPAEWDGRIKTRVWGRVWNLEGELIDRANNVYCWADPARPIQSFDALRDKGAPAAAINVLAWQGSVAATFAALQAAVAPQGGGVACPSIACVKWWTQPAGALTADLKGEIGAGYVETTAQIVQRLVQAGPNTPFAAGTIAAAQAARAMPVGWVAKDDNTGVASMIEELLGNASMLWLLNASGEIVIREWSWGASVATAVSQSVKRTSVIAPVGTRKLGYKRNETQMARGDLAAIVLWGDVGGSGKPEDGATRNVFRGPYDAAETYVPGDTVLWAKAAGGTGGGYTRIGTGSTTGTPPSDTSKWAIFAQPGDDGLPGEAGENGVTTYTWYAYADSADGAINFTTGAPGTRVFQGISPNRTIATESTNPADYAWSQYVGPPGFGLAGANGGQPSAAKIVRVTPHDGTWNPQVYSTESFTGGAFVSFKLEQRLDGTYGGVMVGLNTDPTTADWTTLDYAIYAEAGVTGGNLYFAESGGPTYVGTWTYTDTFAVHYDGASVRYAKNGTVFRTVSASSGLKFFLDSAMAFQGVCATITSWAAAGGRGIQGPAGNNGTNGTNGANGAPAIGFVQDSHPGAGAFISQTWYRPGPKEWYRWDSGSWVRILGDLSAQNLIADSAFLADGVIINAKIGNLQVDTLKIAGNAVTVSVSAYADDSTYLPPAAPGSPLPNPSVTTVRNLVVGTSGGSVILLVQTMVNTGGDFMRVRISRNGSPIRTSGDLFYTSQGTLIHLDTPPAGTHTYSVQVLWYGFGGNYANSTFLSSLETKR